MLALPAARSDVAQHPQHVLLRIEPPQLGHHGRVMRGDRLEPAQGRELRVRENQVGREPKKYLWIVLAYEHVITA